ncbi:hypothetical protein HDU97_004071 [Phlyctochytrium planicorne]|nr:hypothetical protein HDU97_004071 [Phlyctochytrium planicorne]
MCPAVEPKSQFRFLATACDSLDDPFSSNLQGPETPSASAAGVSESNLLNGIGGYARTIAKTPDAPLNGGGGDNVDTSSVIKTKTKAVKYVPSRYMEAAKTVKKEPNLEAKEKARGKPSNTPFHIAPRPTGSSAEAKVDHTAPVGRQPHHKTPAFSNTSTSVGKLAASRPLVIKSERKPPVSGDAALLNPRTSTSGAINVKKKPLSAVHSTAFVDNAGAARSSPNLRESEPRSSIGENERKSLSDRQRESLEQRQVKSSKAEIKTPPFEVNIREQQPPSTSTRSVLVASKSQNIPPSQTARSSQINHKTTPPRTISPKAGLSPCRPVNTILSSTLAASSNDVDTENYARADVLPAPVKDLTDTESMAFLEDIPPERLAEEILLAKSRLLQWKFIRARAAHAFEKRKEKAETQILLVWSLLQQKRAERDKILHDRKMRAKAEAMGEVVQKQLEYLEKLEARSGPFRKHYERLARSLELQAKQVYLEGAVVPSLKYLEDIVAKANAMSSQFLDENEEFFSQMAELSNLVASLQHLDDQIKSENQAVQNMERVVEEARQLRQSYQLEKNSLQRL